MAHSSENRSTTRADNNPPVGSGFMWLGISYVCGTFFFIVSKVLLTGMSQEDFFLWWYGFGLLFHTAYGLVSGGISLGNLRGKYTLYVMGYLVLDLTGTSLFFLAIKMMNPSIVSFFNQSSIIFTILFGYLLLHEVLERFEIVATCIVIAGLFVMTWKSVSIPLLGAVFLTIANFSGAMTMIIVRNFGERVGTLTFARLRSISLFTFFLCWKLATHGRVEIPPTTMLILAVVGAFFGPFLNVISVYKTLEFFPVGKVALFRSVQPLFVVIFGGIFLKMYPGIREMAGGLFVIIGSILLAYLHAKHALIVKRPWRSPRA